MGGYRTPPDSGRKTSVAEGLAGDPEPRGLSVDSECYTGQLGALSGVGHAMAFLFALSCGVQTVPMICASSQ